MTVGGQGSGDERMEEESDVFKRLGTTREGFACMVGREIEMGLSSEYSRDIAEAIVQRVAEDVEETADVSKWNDCDVNLGVGRVILKALLLS